MSRVSLRLTKREVGGKIWAIENLPGKEGQLKMPRPKEKLQEAVNVAQDPNVKPEDILEETKKVLEEAMKKKEAVVIHLDE